MSCRRHVRPTAHRPSARRASDPYGRFQQLDGSHPFKEMVEDGYVDYPARRRRDGEVAYFNFALAREMGLIPASHPDRLTAGLRRAILDHFCIVIVNEYDELHGVEVPPVDRLPGRYMATRYLQLQHPGRRRGSSGDGRSIWNGRVRHGGVTWDVSSQGTGVTRLCPATAIEGRFFKTGNGSTSYGCGTAALAEGLGTALMSEVFHRNGIATERCLAVIALPRGLAINVRAAPCLIRPSHFFTHLERGHLDRLRAVAELYVERQITNGAWAPCGGDARWHRLAEETARRFARATARFERDYVFCWLDWDGDNILTDASIIDYGSVRQFGLYHREYRFDDVDRWSTTIPEQRRKARDIVRKFCQIREALVTGRKPPLRSLRRDPVLDLFDREFARERRRLLLHQLGLSAPRVERLLDRPPACLAQLERALRSFERARAARGPIRVPDGLSWNAVFCVRDLLRELPVHCLRSEEALPAERLIELAASSYASRRDRRVTAWRRRQSQALQRAYRELVGVAARRANSCPRDVLIEIAERSAIINRADRITGNAIDHATGKLIRSRRHLRVEEVARLVEFFAEGQDLRPGATPRRRGAERSLPPPARRLLQSLRAVVEDHREGL